MSDENDRAICCTCKNELELVRPGKHQCNVCDDRPILRHNGVGEADMYSPEEYERIMAGDEVPNQTDVGRIIFTNDQPYHTNNSSKDSADNGKQHDSPI